MKQIYEFKQQANGGSRPRSPPDTQTHKQRNSQHQQQLIPASVFSIENMSIIQLCDPANLSMPALPVAKKQLNLMHKIHIQLTTVTHRYALEKNKPACGKIFETMYWACLDIGLNNFMNKSIQDLTNRFQNLSFFQKAKPLQLFNIGNIKRV